MKKRYRSSLMASIHETAEGLHAIGILDEHAMQEFDEMCLMPVAEPEEFRA
jgi:putative transcriptional regulator